MSTERNKSCIISNSQPNLQAHCQSPSIPRSNQSFVKELQSQRKKKNFLKKSRPFKKIKIADTQADRKDRM
jgi:hypothetical protein